MVVQFGVTNFLSYADPTLIQFSTKSKETSFSDDLKGNRYYKILKYVSIFGSNASGKSGIIKSVAFFKNAVIDNTIFSRSPNFYCRVDEKNKNKPSTFEIVLQIGDDIYQYGFSVMLQSGKIETEYLYLISPSTWNGSKIFERNDSTFNIQLSKEHREFVKVNMDNAKSSNRLILSSIGKILLDKDIPDLIHIKKCFSYIVSKIIIINKNISSQYLMEADKIDDSYVPILNQFDFNISDIKYNTVDYQLISNGLNNKLQEEIIKALFNAKKKSVILFDRGKVFKLRIVDNSIVAQKLVFKHYNSTSEFDFGEESDGTIRIMDFIPILFIKGDYAFFIDEIELSLSIDMVEAFFDVLRSKKSDVQIIYTTHADSLFDQNFQRKDSIYIIEKDNLGVSHIKRLIQYKNIYTENNINSKYVDGRYGGRPRIFTTGD